MIGELSEEWQANLAGLGSVIFTWLGPLRALDIINSRSEDQINAGATLAGIVGVLAVRGLAVGLQWGPSGKRVVYLVAAVVILLFATYLFRAGVVHVFPAEMRSVANGIWGGTYIVAAGFFCAAAVEAMRLPKWSKPR